jgi:hypothetical protein
MCKPSLRIHLSLGKPGNSMVTRGSIWAYRWAGGPDSRREDGKGNMFGYNRWGITSGEEGLCKVLGVGLEVIRLTVDLLPCIG